MRQHFPNVLLFILLAGGLVAGAWYIDKTYFPKPQPKPPEPVMPARELVGALTGAVALGAPPADAFAALPPLPPPTRATLVQSVTGGLYAAALAAPPAPKPVAVRPAEPPVLIALGDDSFCTKAMLNTVGGSVQQQTLNRFDEASRLGLEVKQPDGRPQPLRLIPGVVQQRASLTELHKDPSLARVPELAPGKVPADLAELLTAPSYVMLHYPDKDSPYPSPELGDRTWALSEKTRAAGGAYTNDAGEREVAFETTLGAPYLLKITKTFTLAPKDYHIGLRVDITPLPGRAPDAAKFRYQIAGPRHLPIEGKWYSTAYRHVLVGWRTSSGGAKRTIEDSAAINTKHGGDRVDSQTIEDGSFTYAAVGTQYFASALAVDDTAPAEARNPWEYVRPTREPGPHDDPKLPALSDITFRAVSHGLDLKGPVSHRYLIYGGPIKVRLLGQLGGERSVPEGTIDRYADALTLRTMTDFHSPNALGRFANAIWWTDLVITFTNIMHWVLGGLHGLVGNWGVSIILLTVMVRLILLIPSRKQQIMMARMQEKMAKMKPELDKLQEKYKDNPQLLQQEKAKLMFAHGVNPLSTMGGCLMLFAQMPVFMGLYYCLQESVFFRLESFLGWIPNLSAPDMLVWWTENIPFVSAPENLGGMIYLGPFFNILPLIAVALIFLQQKLTMPPPTDEQQEMQQRMMKIMIVVMAVFFYKVPAGLCLYFICSTSWALAERKLIPKPRAVRDAAGGADQSGGGVKPTGPTKPDAPPPANGAAGGGFIGRLKAKLEEMQQQADDQSRRQVRRDDQPPPRPGGGKKKRRK
ncbi:MAG TPA: membrane protein insertase YidC [Fimbriiglobus sp.]|nr:membrane protein insertase YidC [Fimbriiglobus sp.]